ncbi:MAG: hypothetical protein ABI877_03685 [Gemmatimonadaceae bacterium]
MSSVLTRERARTFAMCVAAMALLGCQGGEATPHLVVDPGALAAKAPSVTVTAANPSYGEQGQLNESVTITGSGFAPGAQAAWLRNGAVDPTITVASTQFVSSTNLVAVISIAPGSPVDFRDVMVTNSSRTQGIGSLLFEVTQANQIPGTSWARSINDSGEATGSLAGSGGVFYFSSATSQLEVVSSTGTGWDISADGRAIVGTGGSGGNFPYLYTRIGTSSSWLTTALPMGATASFGDARSMVTDGTGQVVLIGGNSGGPVVWVWQPISGTWQRTVLSSGGTVRHRALSTTGIVGGDAPASRTLGPAVWTPNGSAGYQMTILAPSGAVNGVRSDGGMLVGFTSKPVYWPALPGGGWGAPIAVSVGGCDGVKDVADAGRFILNACRFTNGGQTFAAYADAPYSSLSRLGGLGPKSNVGFASGISHGGQYAAGYANVNNQGAVGIYWRLP